MASYLVTGGCGFIGSHLVDALLAAGHAVRILDDLSTGRRENVPAAAHLFVGDVADAALVARAMAGTDGCFHLAAIASVERGNLDWLGAHRANLTGSIAVFDAARRANPAGPSPVVYASSAAVYGANPDLPLAETAPPRPLSAYGADKLGSEQHGFVAAHVHGVPTTGLRFFNVYGPRQDPRSPYSGVISIFCDRLRAGLPVTIFGDGGQSRDFVFVADVVRALTAAMARPSTAARMSRDTAALASPDLAAPDTVARVASGAAARHSPEAAARVFNVCTGRAITVVDLAAAIATTLGRQAELTFAPPRAGEIRASLGAASLAADALGFTATTPLHEGLARTLAAG